MTYQPLSAADIERAQVKRTEEAPVCPTCNEPRRALIQCGTCSCVTCHKCCRECPARGERN